MQSPGAVSTSPGGATLGEMIHTKARCQVLPTTSQSLAGLKVQLNAELNSQVWNDCDPQGVELEKRNRCREREYQASVLQGVIWM